MFFLLQIMIGASADSPMGIPVVEPSQQPLASASHSKPFLLRAGPPTLRVGPPTAGPLDLSMVPEVKTEIVS